MEGEKPGTPSALVTGVIPEAGRILTAKASLLL